MYSRANTRVGVGGIVDPPLDNKGGREKPLPTLPCVTNQTKIPYPKPLKHSNKTVLRLNKSENKIYFLIIKTHFGLLKTIFLISVKF